MLLRLPTHLSLLIASASLSAAEFPAVYDSERDRSSPTGPSEAAARVQLPPGFNLTVFAAEPDVQNPIAMAWDGRGRLWIAENYTYAERPTKFDLGLRDRILIFEDRDGDGRFDTRKVFTDEVQMLTSIEIGHGGVWAMCPPQLLFIPDRNGNDVPDGAPDVVLDGFTPPPENYHNYANGLRFGPDGWLYGRCGASSPGEIGKPGDLEEDRIPMRGTMWRFHPRRKVFEALSCGTTNPWGHDWNEHGELFFINTVNGHLWHGFAGAHYMRPHTIDPNPRVYSLIDQHADHWHFDTAIGWAKSRDGIADSFGGGHAHVGMMIYLGDNWPAHYRGRLFTWNMHGRRANQEILERRGSGYMARHGADLFLTSDPWFRGMDLNYGPDGAVFAIDWTDTGECHESTGVHRTSGRIYKIAYGEPAKGWIDLTQLGAAELVGLHTHRNEWFARRARVELASRAAEGRDLENAKARLLALFEQQGNVVVKLRSLWSLYAMGGVDDLWLQKQLQHPNEHIRAWAVRLLSDAWPLDTVMSGRPRNNGTATGNVSPGFVRLAEQDRSGLVRLALASTLQRLPVSQRGPLAGALVARSEDANDHNLPLLIWYGLIPVADAEPATLAAIASRCELPPTRQFIARRLAEDTDSNPAPLNTLLESASAKPESYQIDILNGIAEALTGWRKAKKPAAWDAFAAKAAPSGNEKLRERLRDLSVVFGDGRALDEVKRVALDANAHLTSRKTALQTLIDNQAPDLQQICEQLLSIRFLNPIAARGLAGFDDPSLGPKLVKAYNQFHPSERRQLIAALVSRPAFAADLLEAIAQRRIPRGDLSAFDVRQIRSLQNDPLNRRLAEVWGELRDPSADMQSLIAKWKRALTPAVLAAADRSHGRQLFNTACASCHMLYGEGGKIGPDLTGAGRDNLDYLLENIVDPSAVVTADFRMSVVELKDGRILNGLVAAQTERTVTLATSSETLTIERSSIARIQQSALSMMPESLLDALTADQARDLIAYLMHKSQVPLRSEATSGSN